MKRLSKWIAVAIAGSIAVIAVIVGITIVVGAIFTTARKMNSRFQPTDTRWSPVGPSRLKSSYSRSRPCFARATAFAWRFLVPTLEIWSAFRGMAARR